MQINNLSAFEIKPDAVVFDLDNTLYAYDDAHRAGMNAARHRTCRALGTSLADFDRAFDAARLDVKKKLGATASAHSRLLYFQRMIELLGMKTRVSLSLDLEHTYWRNFMLAARLRPGAVDFLMDLRAAGVVTAVVTDLTAQIQFRKILFLGLEALFDHIVTSEEAGADKVGLLPFKILKEKLALRNSATIWMVGDDSCDLLAKEELNASTILLKLGGKKSSNLADCIFSEFGDLRILTRRWI